MASQNRCAHVERETKETKIMVDLNLDGTGVTDIDTGVGFFDHMLEAFGRHGLFDLTVKATGDLHVDAHHTVEDVGIVLGQAFAQAMGGKRGIVRFASPSIAMDEALIMAAVDVSGRGQLHYAVDVAPCMLGAFDASLAKEFFIALATNAQITLHLHEFAGENAHHVIEACFKATGRALCAALEINPRTAEALPSTKGVL